MKQIIKENQMDEGTIFAKEHIVELAKLIVDWQDSGLLGGGTHCLVDDLCNMLPGDSEIIKLRLAESIIKNICLQMIAFSTSEEIKKNFIQEKFIQEKFNKAVNDILKGSRQRLAESIIKDICLQMVAFSTSEAIKKNLIQEKFNKAFNDILKGSTQRYLDPDTDFIKVSNQKTTRIEVLDKNNEWLIDYDTNPKNTHFWYHYDRVYYVLQNLHPLQHDDIQRRMKSLVETQYKILNTQPSPERGL